MTPTRGGSSAAQDGLRVTMTVEQCWQRVPGGSATYIARLAQALAPRWDVAVTGLAAAHRAEPATGPMPAVPVRHAPLPRAALYRAWNTLGAPRAETVVAGTQVVHATTWAVPPTRRPLVVTVHDLAFLRDESHFTARGVRFFVRSLERVRDEATAVVVPSHATAADCVAAGLPADRIHVAPHGAPDWVRDEAAAAEVRRRFDLPARFVLWCGTHEPRKNLGTLLAAFSQVAERERDLHLVLVGPSGWGGEVAAPAGPGADRVHQVGRVADADLPALYAAAEVFCFPSLWEGFGLPVLEAMTVGTPVVTSLGTSTAEVVGDAGVLVDPHDADDVARGLLLALGSGGLGAAGLARSASFTWEASAEIHVAAYRAALGG